MSDLSDSQTGRTESDSPNACRRCAGTSTGNRALSVHVEHRCDKGGGAAASQHAVRATRPVVRAQWLAKSTEKSPSDG